MQMLKLIFLFFVIIPMINLIPGAEAHPLFNSGEEWIGDHRIQIATLPEIPAVNEEIQVLFQVVDTDFQEVDHLRWELGFFMMGSKLMLLCLRYTKMGLWKWIIFLKCQETMILELIYMMLPMLANHLLTQLT